MKFRVHLQTWWDLSRWVLLVLVLAGAAVLGYFVYIWGFLPTPAGVLVPVETPDGETLQRIRLGAVKRGVFSAWLSPRRNCVSIASRRADICYRRLPPDIRVELAFYRWPGTFICHFRNHSIGGSAMTVRVNDPVIGSLNVRRSLRLKHGSVLEFGGYKFRYESVR